MSWEVSRERNIITFGPSCHALWVYNDEYSGTFWLEKVMEILRHNGMDRCATNGACLILHRFVAERLYIFGRLWFGYYVSLAKFGWHTHARWMRIFGSDWYRYYLQSKCNPWWRHQIETFSALLAICAGNSPATQRPVTWSFDVSFDLRLYKRLSTKSKSWWFETPSHPFWHQCNVITTYHLKWGLPVTSCQYPCIKHDV